MEKPIQKRTLATRAKLIAAGEAIVSEGGFDALRVEEVVSRAGVAKGTFFAHFRDKDALMERLIGARLDNILDALSVVPAPATIDAMVDEMLPMLQFMVSERYVFDMILRYSGAALIDDIGPIGMCIGRHETVVMGWLNADGLRRDVAPKILAEGIQAFVFQTLALHFCALHSDIAIQSRLRSYLKPWLLAH
jgi:AcrR family transcriptional regulator